MKKTKHKGTNKKATMRANDPPPSKPETPNQSRKEKSELIHINQYQANESIAKSIVDKIITISVRQSHNKHLNRRYNNYYFEYMQAQLDSLFATNFLYYYDEPETEERNKIFWNKNLDKKNTWIEIIEPNSSKIDRYENIFMKFVDYNPPTEENIDIKKSPFARSNTLKEGSSSKNDLLDSKVKSNSSKRYSVKMKDYMIKKTNNKILDILEERSSASSKDEENNLNPKKIPKIKKSIRNSISSINKNLLSKRESLKNVLTKSQSPQKEQTTENENNNDDKDEIEQENPRLKKKQILSMNYEEIPDLENELNSEAYSPPEVESLRKEIVKGKIRKEKEEKKQALIRKMSTINNTDENIFENDKRIIDSNKLTFDSNGEIISFKPFKIETLSKDFVSLKNGIKSPELNNVNNKKTKMKKNKNNKSEDVSKTNIPKEKTKEKEIIVKNPEDDPNGKNKLNYVKISKIKNEQIIPSGSNFSLLLPNIGVTLKENDQVKKGTHEFGKFFKKYSINDYNKILRDYLPLQNKSMLKSKMSQSSQSNNLTTSNINLPKKLNANTSYKYTSTNPTINNNININLPFTQTQNFNSISELSNPLINQPEANQENDLNSFNNNNSSLLKSNKSINSYYFSGNNLYSGSLSKLRNNMSNFTESKFITLNRNCSSSSLKNEIENVKDLNEEDNFNFYPTKIRLQSRNIFQENYKEFYKNKKIKEKTINIIGKGTNELNKKIMINGLWGTQTLQKNKSSENLLFSKHLTKYQALRELGSNLLSGIKVKLPRDRKVDINI
jgi:hypothetical protein